MGHSALVPGPLYGLRAWTVVGEPGDERLAGPHEAVSWPPRGAWLEATCARAGGHVAPAPDCSCGVHAWHPRRRWARRVLAGRRAIAGVVEATGAVEVHEEGFRAQRARPCALVQGDRNPSLVRRLAAVYRVPVIESGDAPGLVEWCRQRGLGLDESVVAELLGPAEIEHLHRTRRRRTRVAALKLAATLVAVVLLLVSGLRFATDPPEKRSIHGRTGPIVVGHDASVPREP